MTVCLLDVDCCCVTEGTTGDSLLSACIRPQLQLKAPLYPAALLPLLQIFNFLPGFLKDRPGQLLPETKTDRHQIN